MNTQAVEAPRVTGTDDGLDHLYCCDPNWSTCGRDLSAVPENDDLSDLCVVCAEMEHHPCPCDCGCCPAGRPR